MKTTGTVGIFIHIVYSKHGVTLITPGGVPGVLYQHVVSALPLAITDSEHCMVQWVKLIWVGDAIVSSDDTALVRMDVYIISINSDGKRLSIKG